MNILIYKTSWQFLKTGSFDLSLENCSNYFTIVITVCLQTFVLLGSIWNNKYYLHTHCRRTHKFILCCIQSDP